jgi:hypothetical protein
MTGVCGDLFLKEEHDVTQRKFFTELILMRIHDEFRGRKKALERFIVSVNINANLSGFGLGIVKMK